MHVCSYAPVCAHRHVYQYDGARYIINRGEEYKTNVFLCAHISFLLVLFLFFCRATSTKLLYVNGVLKKTVLNSVSLTGMAVNPSLYIGYYQISTSAPSWPYNGDIGMRAVLHPLENTLAC